MTNDKLKDFERRLDRYWNDKCEIGTSPEMKDEALRLAKEIWGEEIPRENITVKCPHCEKDIVTALDTLMPPDKPQDKEHKLTKEFIQEHYDDFLGYYYNAPCSGCKGGHASFWKTIIESTAWGAWKEKNAMAYDFAECEKLGIMSKEHWVAFLDFIKKQALSKPQDAQEHVNKLREEWDKPQSEIPLCPLCKKAYQEYPEYYKANIDCSCWKTHSNIPYQIMKDKPQPSGSEKCQCEKPVPTHLLSDYTCLNCDKPIQSKPDDGGRERIEPIVLWTEVNDSKLVAITPREWKIVIDTINELVRAVNRKNGGGIERGEGDGLNTMSFGLS